MHNLCVHVYVMYSCIIKYMHVISPQVQESGVSTYSVQCTCILSSDCSLWAAPCGAAVHTGEERSASHAEQGTVDTLTFAIEGVHMYYYPLPSIRYLPPSSPFLPSSYSPSPDLQSPMTKLFRKVFPYILQLACDAEKVLCVSLEDVCCSYAVYTHWCVY